MVGVGAPYRGTPIAAYFAGVRGHRLLGLLSLATAYSLRFGGLPLGALAKLVGVFARVDDVLRLNRNILDQLGNELLSDFSPERRRALASLLTDVKTDHSLIPQLTPRRMQLFHRTTPDRPGVRYGSVVTRGRRPGIRTTWRAGLDPYAQLTHSWYALLHSLSTQFQSRRRPQLPEAYRAPLSAHYGDAPTWLSSDGVVPSLSQLHGELVHAASADHLDVIGHFEDRDHFPPHYDWLASGSGFGRREFETLWGDVVAFALRDSISSPWTSESTANHHA